MQIYRSFHKYSGLEAADFTDLDAYLAALHKYGPIISVKMTWYQRLWQKLLKANPLPKSAV